MIIVEVLLSTFWVTVLYLLIVFQRTEGYSGSDIRLLCKEAAMRKVRKIFDLLESHHTGRLYEIRESLSAHKVEMALQALVLFFEFQFLFKFLSLPLSQKEPLSWKTFDVIMIYWRINRLREAWVSWKHYCYPYLYSVIILSNQKMMHGCISKLFSWNERCLKLIERICMYTIYLQYLKFGSELISGWEIIVV